MCDHLRAPTELSIRRVRYGSREQLYQYAVRRVREETERRERMIARVPSRVGGIVSHGVGRLQLVAPADERSGHSCPPALVSADFPTTQALREGSISWFTINVGLQLVSVYSESH